MQKHDDETIRQEVREHWDRHVNILEKIAMLFRVLEYGSDPRLTIFEKITNKQTYDYRSPKPDTTGLLNNPVVVLDELAPETLTKLVGECLFDYDKFLCNTDTPIIVSIFGTLRIERDRLINKHNNQRQRFAAHIKNMKKLILQVDDSYPDSHKQLVQNAHDNIEHIDKFSKYMIYFLKNEWPNSFNLVKNLNKSPKSQPCWNNMMNNMFDILINNPGKPFIASEAYRYIAKFLGLIYPITWAGDVQSNANLVRNRVENYKLNLRGNQL